MPLLGCPHGISQAITVQAPKRGEGLPVDLEQTALAEDAGPVERRARWDRREHGLGAEDEKVKVLVHAEPRVEETPLLVGGQGGGHDSFEALLRQHSEAASHELCRHFGAVRHGYQEGDSTVGGPGAGAGTFLTPADHVAYSGHLSSR
jgi:hypothetical protein